MDAIFEFQFFFEFQVNLIFFKVVLCWISRYILILATE